MEREIFTSSSYSGRGEGDSGVKSERVTEDKRKLLIKRSPGGLIAGTFWYRIFQNS